MRTRNLRRTLQCGESEIRHTLEHPFGFKATRANLGQPNIHRLAFDQFDTDAIDPARLMLPTLGAAQVPSRGHQRRASIIAPGIVEALSLPGARLTPPPVIAEILGWGPSNATHQSSHEHHSMDCRRRRVAR